MSRKIIIVAFVMVCSCFVKIAAQENTFTIYYDSLWNKVPKENAFFYTEFVKQDSFYKCTSYWVQSKKINCISNFTDTNFTKGLGKLIRYYENGTVADSVQFGNNGIVADEYQYSTSGILSVHTFFDQLSHSIKAKRYDSNGKPIGGDTTLSFVTIQIQAKFPGGPSAWQDYLMNNLKLRTPKRNGAPPGNYTVVVSFIVDIEGKTNDVKADNDPGYGTAEEAVRVIEKSPAWIPATQNGKKVTYKQKQSITFQVN